MRTSIAVALAVTLAMTAVPALANTVYKCDIEQIAANGNGLPPLVFVERIGATRKATVMDGYVKHYLGTPADAVVQTDNATRITFSWTLDAADGNGDLTRMSFHLTYMKATGVASMFSEWLGYTNQYLASGKCKVR